MRFPQKFPYTSINNINLDWIIKKVKEALRIANEAAGDVSGAIEAAAAAEASADAAQAAAQAAESAAAGVVDTAEEALTTAQAAQTTAEGIAGTASQALTTAQAAQTTANSANTTAQAAQTTAEGIATTANTALSTANSANTTAQAAQTTAEGVESIAQAAQTTANSANTAAQAAQTTANSANTTANTALARALPSGGSAGQVLAKVDGTDYNAHWIPAPDPTGYVSYANAQTLTDAQKTQARGNINASEKWTLLWQNASPTSTFGPQTITLSEDSHNYDYLAFAIRNVGGVQYIDNTFFNGAEAGVSSIAYVTADNVTAIRARQVFITNASVRFGDNRQCTLAGASPTLSTTTRNDISQPVTIYGVNI